MKSTKGWGLGCRSMPCRRQNPGWRRAGHHPHPGKPPGSGGAASAGATLLRATTSAPTSCSCRGSHRRHPGAPGILGGVQPGPDRAATGQAARCTLPEQSLFPGRGGGFRHHDAVAAAVPRHPADRGRRALNPVCHIHRADARFCSKMKDQAAICPVRMIHWPPFLAAWSIDERRVSL